MKRLVVSALLVITALFFAPPAQAAVTVIHNFSGSNGQTPFNAESNLVVLDGKLYGTTYAGGTYGAGTIFRSNLDGSSYTVLRHFQGGASDGSNPYSTPIESGGVLYGMTSSGGDMSRGVLYKINIDGTGYSHLHEFLGGGTDGQDPRGMLLLSAGVLYGMTSSGGDSNIGTIFKINIDGSGFTLLHEFTGGAEDGSTPYGSLIISNTVLYGMTSLGGDSNVGTIFKINTDGTSHTILREFVGGNSDGSTPNGTLLLHNDMLWGMTQYGGGHNKGIIFKIKTDGTDFAVHLAIYYGGYPKGSIIYIGGFFYAISSNYIIRVHEDGTRSGNIDTFTSSSPGNLVISDGVMYAGASSGGTYNSGYLFSLDTSTFLPVALSWIRPASGSTIISQDQWISFYTNDNATCRLSLSDESYTDMADDVICTKGSGTTQHGCLTPNLGADGSKNVYISCANSAGQEDTISSNENISYSLVKTEIESVYNFPSSGLMGSDPKGGLIHLDGWFYGMTSWGGSDGVYDDGVIFKVKPDGNEFTLLHEFNNNDGSGSYGTLLHSSGVLYGVTENGGQFGGGVIFRLNLDGSNYQLLHEFTGESDDGGWPLSADALTLVGNTLYGTTYSGGADYYGTIFKINTDGSNFTLLHEFNGIDGYEPEGSLTYLNGALYGFTSDDDTYGGGNLFKINPDGTGFEILVQYDWSEVDGG